MNNIVLIIPSLEPKENFIKFLSDAKKSFKNIIVVNDGSSSKYDYIFKKIEKDKILVLKHHINLGKGQALKTAFNYVLHNMSNIEIIVTADSDGQHAIKDIVKCAENALENKDKLILGVRNFSKKNVPLRNKFGNKLTCFVLKSLFNIEITDSQTGLRAFSIKTLEKIINSKGSRFEYETNVLIDAKRNGILFKEVKIDTIYLEDSNKNSHFNPIIDSYKVYRVFYKEIIFLLLSYIINILVFSIIYLEKSTLLIPAVFLSKIISTCSNILLNRDKEYNTNYFTNQVINVFISAFVVSSISAYTDKIILWKIITDLIIAIIMLNIKLYKEFKE